MRKVLTVCFIPFVAIAAMIRETMVEGEPGLAMGIAGLLIAGFLLFLSSTEAKRP